jgi:predicted Zn-dependent protease
VTMMLATALSAQGKYAEGIAVLDARPKAAVADPRANFLYAQLYTESKRFKEAVPYLVDSSKQYPEDASLIYQLGNAYLHAEQTEEALKTYEKLLALDRDKPLHLNNVAYQLALQKTQLEKAEAFARQSLELIAADLKGSTPSDFPSTRLQLNNLQFMAWDTLGWVYRQQGKLSEAERFVRASWVSEQNLEVAEHLAEIYHELNQLKSESIIRSLAASLPKTPKTLSEAFALMKKNKDAPVLQRRPGNPSSDLSLQDMRTVKLTRKLKQTANAEFFLLLSPQGKAEVRFLDGDEALKDWVSTIQQAKLPGDFPDNRMITKIARKAALSCSSYSSECVLVLYPPRSVMSVE